ncbi:MAG: DnaJ domain-containing protein [Holophagaceae bacterium]|nr:DnaJ domain-containing protein [Holophagaceae bacterium]
MNPHEVLQIKPDASAEEIMAAYLRLAQQWHPDRYTGAEKLEAAMRYRELAEAFTRLKGLGRPQAPIALQNPAPNVEPAPSAASAAPMPTPFESQKIRIQTEAEIADSAPRTERTLYVKAKTEFENGQFPSALENVAEAIKQDPEQYENYALQVKILDAMDGDKRSLVQALEHCLRLDKKDADSAIHIAQIYQSMGMQTRATRYWEWAFNLAPKHPFFEQQEVGAKGKLLEKADDIKGSITGLMEEAKGIFGRFGKKG